MASKQEKSLLIGLAIFIVATPLLGILGFYLLSPPVEMAEGQVEVTSVRISGKLPGRIEKIYVEEGQMVAEGDTLIRIHSSIADARLFQAEAMENVASAQNAKVEAGTRWQIIQGANDLWQQAVAARTIAQKTYERMQSLYEKGVVSEQKRDEAKAAYDVALAGEQAAQSNYNLALSGAQSEDKQSAKAMENAARGSVMEVEALLEDKYLTAPCDGEIGEIYPHEGELVAMGTPLMSILKMQDKWITFNVNERRLSDLPIGRHIEMMLPALNDTIIDGEVYFVAPLGSYAVWRATKSTGEYDTRTFKVKVRPYKKIERMRPGMSVIYQYSEK